MPTDPTDHPPIVTIERHILDEQHRFPDATGVLTNLLYDIALAGKGHREQDHASRARGDPRPDGGDERPGGGGPEARPLRRHDDLSSDGPHGAAGGHGVGGARGRDPDSGRVSGRKVRAPLRPARRIGEHRLQHPDRHDLLDLPQEVERRARKPRRLPAAGPGSRRRRLHHLRVEHDARLRHARRGPRLHARPERRGVPAVAPRDPDPGRAGLLQREPRQPIAAGAKACAGTRTTCRVWASE